MTPLPITYARVHVAFVWLDSSIHRQIHQLPWHLEIPRGVRQARHTRDVLIGLLREDEEVLKKCRVYMMLNGVRGFKVSLPKVVLYPELIPQLLEFQLFNNPRKEILFHDIRSRLMSINKIIHIDNNKLNCQANNLRELSYEPLEEPSGLYQED